MGNESGFDLEAQLRLVTEQIEQTMRLLPQAVAEVSASDAESGKLLEEVFSDLQAHRETAFAVLAAYPKEMAAMIAEAEQCAADVESILAEAPAGAASPAAAETPVAEPALDLAAFEFATRLGRELVDRFGAPATAPAVPEHPPGFDSRIWFDMSRAGDLATAGGEMAELQAILSGVTARVATWWACVALSEMLQSEWNQLPPPDQTAIETAVGWTMNPTNAAKTALASRASSSQEATIGAALSELFRELAESEVAAGDRVAARALHVFCVGCRSLDEPTNRRVIRHALRLARDMRGGERLWPQTADTKATITESLATFSRWSAE